MMAKGKGAAVSGDAAAPKTKAGGWKKSTMSEQQITALRKEGQLPPVGDNKVRCPGDEVTPKPNTGERIMFASFVSRGLSLPIHDFVRGLLYAYGVQLHDFAPNSIQQIAYFIVLCECFLGVNLH
jgi:hypothetical protein